MSVGEWEIGDYVVGETERIDRNEVGYRGKHDQVRLLGEVDPDEIVLARITDTQAVGVVAEPVSGIDSDDTTVWVQRTTDINPRDPDQGHSGQTFDEMAGGTVVDELSPSETPTRDEIQMGVWTSLGYSAGAILVGAVGLLGIGYVIEAVLPPEGVTGYLVLSAGSTVATLLFWLSLTLLGVGLGEIALTVKSAILE